MKRTVKNSKQKTRNKPATFDVYEKLKKDHRTVEKLFSKILKTEDTDTETRESLFEQIFTELEAHAQAEEKLFYPRTEQNEKTHDLTLEAYEEHRLVKQLLQELHEMEKDSDVWAAKVTVLSELVKHHVKEEEEELFPKSKKVISKDESVELAQDIQSEEEQVKENILEEFAA